ncbi:hypothetical protein KC331_g18754 [Hortaea werneckii]|nr:hypothetical protein KC331_g18754 [Hortaea werneckii]
MSQERKLRNPPTQFSFRQTPASKQQNFLQQMRDGIEQGRGFTRQQDQTRQQQEQRQRHQRASQQLPEYQYGGDTEDDEEDFHSPAKNRTRGELQLRESQWRWAGDQPKDTGLEDLFGGKSFSLADEPAISGATSGSEEEGGRTRYQVNNQALLRVGFVLVVAVVGMAGFWAVKPVRRGFCLWLVGRLEGMGY